MVTWRSSSDHVRASAMAEGAGSPAGANRNRTRDGVGELRSRREERQPQKQSSIFVVSQASGLPRKASIVGRQWTRSQFSKGVVSSIIKGAKDPTPLSPQRWNWI